MIPGERRFSIRLFLAFAVIGVAFVASSLYASWRSLEIDGETRAILSNALPSVDHLTAATDATRDLEAATDDYPDLPPEKRSAARANIASLRRAVDAELDAYRALPVFVGEEELYADVPQSLREVDGTIERLVAESERGDLESARAVADRQVRTAANRTAHLLRHLVRLNVAEAAASSTRIERTRRTVVDVAMVLDGITLALTMAIAFWTWRIFHSYSRLQDAHATLVEQRADELEIFARRVAHDLLSPISALAFCLGAFKQAGASDPKLEGALSRAWRCVHRARALVDNVFDFAVAGGAPAVGASTDVREVVDEVVEEAKAADPEGRADIEVSAVPACAVGCSRGVLASILGNLVRNAIKFMSDSIVRRVAIRVVEDGREVRFEVEDTGPGVPPELAQAIFEPYVRGDGVTQPGLGLGLATVKRYCEAHGGSVGTRPAPDHGAVFFFSLPKAGVTVPERALPAAPSL